MPLLPGMKPAKEDAEPEQSITITIKPKDIVRLQDDASTLVFNPEAEKALLQLLDLQAMVAVAVGAVKNAIVEQGLAYNPNFTSVGGDQIKANFSYAGAKYKINAEEVKRFRPPYFVPKTTYSIDSKLVEKYEMKHKGRLPKGIVKAERNKNLSFKVK